MSEQKQLTAAEIMKEVHDNLSTCINGSSGSWWCNPMQSFRVVLDSMSSCHGRNRTHKDGYLFEDFTLFKDGSKLRLGLDLAKHRSVAEVLK